ncbi:MAG TPA: CHRD domain-containing protein [Steroidobacteraceae bacterium]|nr:CHRD domain-containing protein [Steroidobacteraceae bacterium]
MNKKSLAIGGMIAALALAGSAYAADVKVTLSGAEEVPAVTTSATGTGTITIKDDKTITGSVTTKDIVGVAAHIHRAPAGKNGPPVVPMTKTAEGVWSIAEGTKLSDELLAAFKAGELYVNVHSAANKGGEIRGQLKP